MLIKQPLREALFILILLTCRQLAAEELELPDGSTARTPDERLQFLKSFLALKIKRDLVNGNTESALEYFQEIIDQRSAAIGRDFEEAMKPKEKEEQKIWEFGGKK